MSSKTKTAVKAAIHYCQEHDLRFTEPRRYVLEIIANAKSPLTAYEVLDLLAQKLDRPKPPTAYRALEFLLKHQFIHRIESLNAYVACTEDHKHQGSQFIICDSCSRVEEIHLCHIPDALKKQAKDKGFHLTSWNTELHGTCKFCS